MEDRRDAEKIRFNIKLADGSYRGEISGRDLKLHRVFEVKLTTGEEFAIEAYPDRERMGYDWICYTKDRFARIVPLIGRVIERYFSRFRK